MKCMFCNKGPADGVNLFRINSKGEPGKWACQKHIKRTDAKVDPEVQALVDAVHRGRRVLESR